MGIISVASNKHGEVSSIPARLEFRVEESCEAQMAVSESSDTTLFYSFSSCMTDDQGIGAGIQMSSRCDTVPTQATDTGCSSKLATGLLHVDNAMRRFRLATEATSTSEPVELVIGLMQGLGLPSNKKINACNSQNRALEESQIMPLTDSVSTKYFAIHKKYNCSLNLDVIHRGKEKLQRQDEGNPQEQQSTSKKSTFVAGATWKPNEAMSEDEGEYELLSSNEHGEVSIPTHLEFGVEESCEAQMAVLGNKSTFVAGATWKPNEAMSEDEGEYELLSSNEHGKVDRFQKW